MIPEFFELYELLPQAFYETHYPVFGDRLWNMFDHRILETADNLRRLYGPMRVNTWRWGGEHQWRGWRPSDCDVGAILSQHKYGRALDLEPVSEGVNQIRMEILEDLHPYCFRFITAVEEAVPWLHIDCRNHHKERFGILRF